MESLAVTWPVALYLWIRAVPVIVTAVLSLCAGLTAIFSADKSRRTDARAVLTLLHTSPAPTSLGTPKAGKATRRWFGSVNSM